MNKKEREALDKILDLTVREYIDRFIYIKKRRECEKMIEDNLKKYESISKNTNCFGRRCNCYG